MNRNVGKGICLFLVVLLAVGLGLVAGPAPIAQAAPAYPNCTVGSGADFATISAALADTGCTTINVAAGSYPETVTVSRLVTINGAGSGAGGTVISATGGTGGVVQLAASGLSASQPILLENLRIQPTGRAGISVGQFPNGTTGTNVSYIELNNVKVVGTNTSPCTEQERGLFVDLTSSLTHLKIANSAFDNLHYGWYFQKQVSADTSTVQYVDVQNTTFNHNNLKGLYAEKLEDATFTNVVVSQNGYDASLLAACSYFAPWMSGFDINLKAGTYQNLSFVSSVFANNALGGAKEGVGLAVKERGSGNDPSYGAFPATLSVVTVSGSLVSGNERGIRFGEPGKNNTGPTNVAVHNTCISGNVQTYSGTDGSAYGGLVNMSQATTDATNNWWGDASGPTNVGNPTGTGDAAVGLVTFSPWNTIGCPNTKLSTATDDALFCVGEQTSVTIDLAQIANLYGYQFQVSYDQAKASATGAFVNSFFDTTGQYKAWNADCITTPGTCKFAVTKTGSAAPVTGTGTLATITLTGVAPGTFNMAISDNVLSDIDGAALFHNLGTSLPMTVCGSTTVSGKVTLQGRFSGNVDAGTVTLTDLGGNFPQASGPFSATDGAFSLSVPVMPAGSNYQMDAAHGLYLTNRKTPVALTAGVPLANQTTRLWGGDATNDGEVRIADLSCIGGAFGQSPVTTVCGGPPPLSTGSPDINADTKVNIQDLSIAGGNFDKCGWQPWNWAVDPSNVCSP
jgi:hypothetical protein